MAWGTEESHKVGSRNGEIGVWPAETKTPAPCVVKWVQLSEQQLEGKAQTGLQR